MARDRSTGWGEKTMQFILKPASFGIPTSHLEEQELVVLVCC